MKPNVYYAYENTIDGDDVGYFWNEFDAFIAIMEKHRKNLFFAKKHYKENKNNPDYPESYKRMDKNIVLMFIKKLGKWRIKKIDIK